MLMGGRFYVAQTGNGLGNGCQESAPSSLSANHAQLSSAVHSYQHLEIGVGAKIAERCSPSAVLPWSTGSSVRWSSLLRLSREAQVLVKVRCIEPLAVMILLV